MIPRVEKNGFMESQMERRSFLKEAYNARFLILALIVIHTSLRLYVFMTFPPQVVGGDPAWYTKVSESLFLNNLLHYNGERTPGYPFLLWFFGYNTKLIIIFHMILGVSSSVLFFMAGVMLTGMRKLAFALALFPIVLLNPILHETNLMTETVVTFAIITVALLAIMEKQGRSKIRLCAMGVILSAVVLTRPEMLIMASLIFLWVVTFGNQDLKGRISAGLSYGLPLLITVLSLSTFNYVTINHFKISTLVGFNLTNHSGRIFEKAPDEYKELREIYLKYREMRMSASGCHSMTIFIGAEAEMREKLNLTYPELSAQLKDVSVLLFLEYPGVYVNSVFRAWLGFWGTTKNYVRRYDGLKTLATSWVSSNASYYVHLFLYMTFVLSAGLFIFLKRDLLAHSECYLFMLIVFTASVVQALLEFGDNPRYAMPYIPLMMLVIAKLVSTYHSSFQEGSPEVIKT